MTDQDLLTSRLALEPTAKGFVRSDVDEVWQGHASLFGGYAQALVLEAMRLGLGHQEKHPVSMTMHFMRPFGPGPVRVETSVERDGRSMANVVARAYSGEAFAGLAVASFAVRRDVGSFTEVQMPDVQPWDPGEEPVDPPTGVPTHTRFDFFPRIGPMRFGGGPARTGGWVRPRFDTPVNASLLVMLADLWLPAAYRRWDDPMVAVSADITLHFRDSLADPVIEPGTPLLVTLETAAASLGFVDEDVEVWSPDGRLLLQGRQARFITDIPSPRPADGAERLHSAPADEAP